MEKTFSKEQLSVIHKVSSDITLASGSEGMDFIRDEMTIKLSCYVLSNMAEERTLTYYCERPKFLDWLFRRRKKVEFNLQVKDLLINPPNPCPEVIRIYIPDQK